MSGLVRLYVLPGCSSCELVKKVVETTGVDVEICDAIEYREYLIANKVVSLPVLEVDGKFVYTVGEIIKCFKEWKRNL